MKKTFLALLAVTTVVTGSSFAAAATPAAKQPAAAAAATPKIVGEAKSIPMYSRADVIDLKARTFTTKRKDGVEVKHVVTAATEIKQDQAAARLEDIKVGDYVSGSRKKVSETEYTVVKITKFGPKADKKPSTPVVRGETKPKAN